jgi:metallophosphoesterase superfamily enzyme
MVLFMKQIKLLTYADLHIGAPIIDNWDVLRKIVDIAIEHKVTHIASLGDDFDKEITTTTQREYFATQVKRALDAGIHYGIIPGNHSRRAEMQCYKTGAEVWSTPGWYLMARITYRCIAAYEIQLFARISYRLQRREEN